MRHLVFVLTMLISSSAFAAEVLLEAEGFADHGGWTLDSQFLDVMGSPYLLAHGLGKPVSNAVTAIDFPETGTYRLWVRTKDWVPSHHPGCFKVIILPLESLMSWLSVEGLQVVQRHSRRHDWACK